MSQKMYRPWEWVGGEPSERKPAPDTVFTALSNQRRRYALSYLIEQDEPVGIKELSRRVAAKENEVPVEEVTHKQRKRVYIALHQNHLEHLEDLDLIECGRSCEAITLTDHASGLEPFLDPSVRNTGPTPALEPGSPLSGHYSSLWHGSMCTRSSCCPTWPTLLS